MAYAFANPGAQGIRSHRRPQRTNDALDSGARHCRMDVDIGADLLVAARHFTDALTEQ